MSNDQQQQAKNDPQQQGHNNPKPLMDLNPPVVSGGHGKETAPASETKPNGDSYVTEVPTVPEIEKHPELAGYVENVDKNAQLPQSVVDDYVGQILLPTDDKKTGVVTLPLTEQQVTEGLHHKVSESVRWLAEWCVRQIKLLHGKVKYRG